MNKLVSIVIPMYKAENYIKDCLESVLEQDYEPVEIILVDDGSPDSCVQISEEYCKKHDNIHLHRQVNSGAGAARNHGLNMSKGEYVFFLDADDCLDGKDALSKLVACASENNADITCGSFRKLTEKGISEVNYHHLDDVAQETVDFRFKGYFQYGHLGFNWGKLYRRQFIEENNLRIPTYPYIEDKAFNMRCSVYQPHYAFVKESVYLYRISNQAVAFQDKKDFSEVWIQVVEDLARFVSEQNIVSDYHDIMAFHLFLGIYSLANQRLNSADKGIIKLRNALKQYGKTKFVQEYLKELAKGKYVSQIESVAWKTVIRATSILYSIKLYFVLALGMTLVNKLQIDKRIIAKKYSKEE